MKKTMLWMAPAVVAVPLVLGACGDDGGSKQTAGDGSDGNVEATLVADDGGGNTQANIPSTVELVDELRPSVVHILSQAESLDPFGQPFPQEGVGTGFIIDDEGHIVTNNHVITGQDGEAADKITVTLSDGRQFDATIVGRDPPSDVAVLKIDARNLEPATLGNSAKLQVGQEVIAMGNALNLPGGPTVTKGVVSAVNRLIQEDNVSIPDAIQTDAAINPGNSGGPLVDARGKVVGITTAVIRGNAEGIGLAIAIDTAKPIVEELIASGQVDRGFLGVSIVQITGSLQTQLDLPVDSGVGIQQLQAGSPAADAGLEEGDIIVSMEDVEISTTGDLFHALSEFRSGDTVTVEYYRGDQQESAEVTLG